MSLHHYVNGALVPMTPEEEAAVPAGWPMRAVNEFLVPLTQAEADQLAARNQAFDAQNTLDARAARAVDGVDRLQFEHLFDLENRTRTLEGLSTITRVQYRNALINRWKALNS